MLGRVITSVIALVVTAGWATNLVLGFFNPALRDPDLNTIFAIIVGSAFVASKRSESKKSKLDEVRKSVADLISPDPASGDGEGQGNP